MADRVLDPPDDARPVPAGARPRLRQHRGRQPDLDRPATEDGKRSGPRLSALPVGERVNIPSNGLRRRGAAPGSLDLRGVPVAAVRADPAGRAAEVPHLLRSRSVRPPQARASRPRRPRQAPGGDSTPGLTPKNRRELCLPSQRFLVSRHTVSGSMTGPRDLGPDELRRCGLGLIERFTSSAAPVQRVYCLRCGGQVASDRRDADPNGWWVCARGCNTLYASPTPYPTDLPAPESRSIRRRFESR